MLHINLSSKNQIRLRQWKGWLVCFTVAMPFFLLSRQFRNSPILFHLSCLATGIIVWTYAEYHAHRFWMHSPGQKANPNGRHLHHHHHPTEIKVSGSQRIVMVMLNLLFISLGIWWNNYFSFFSGLFLGFTLYAFMHWILHQSWSARMFPNLSEHHVHHHCKYPDKCFGVTCTWWDHIFNTTAPKTATVSDRIRNFYFGKNHRHAA